MKQFIFLLTLTLLCYSAYSQIPRAVSYQGMIVDAAGAPISDGDHTLRLKIYDALTGGTELFAETQSVVIKSGIFNVAIGAASGGIPVSLTFDRQYFLGIIVDGTAELAPRTPLLPAPYALRAAAADVAQVAESLKSGAAGVVTSLNGGDGALTLQGGGGTTVNRAGNVITISSTGGSGGSGIQGLQNTDGALTVTNPNGPVATIGLAPGIIPTSLPPNGAAGGVLTGTYPNPGLAPGTIPASLPPNGAAGGGLTGTYPNPTLANGSVSTPTLATNAVTSTKIADSTIIGADIAAGVIPSSLPPSGTAGGDLSGTYPNPTVAKLQGRTVSSSAPSAGQVLKFNGSVWIPDPDNPGPWTTSSTNISNSNSGNVGIGTANPSTKLDVAGTTRTRDLQITNGASSGRMIVSTASGTATWTSDLKIVSGNIGMGDTTPNAKLHVVAGSSGFSPSFTRSMLIEENGHLTLSLRGPTNFEQSILFERPVGDTGLRISSQPDGDMRIGRYRFTDNGSASSSYYLFLDVQTGNFGVKRDPVTNDLEVDGTASKTTAGDWLANSDRRIKTDIRDIEGSFATLLKLHPVKFRYSDQWRKRNPSIEDRDYYNFIAQEYQKVFPDAVQSSGEYLPNDPDAILQIDTYDAQIVTIRAVQELIRENVALKERTGDLEQKLDQILTKVSELEEALKTVSSRAESAAR